MPTQETDLQRKEREASERKQLIASACLDVDQSCIDLMCVTISEDSEKRSAAYWIGDSFVKNYKYMLRLREAANVRKANEQRANNQKLFDMYIKLNPPKSAQEYLTLLQRYGLVDSNPFSTPVAEQAKALTQVPSHADEVAQAEYEAAQAEKSA